MIFFKFPDQAPGEVGPVLKEGRHGQQPEEQGAPGGQGDPEEPVEEGKVEPASRDQATVRVEHQEAAEHKAEEEGVVVNVTDDVAKSDKKAAESRSQAGALL